MSSQNIKNLGVIDGDFNKISNKCVKNLYQNVDILENLESFFPNIKDLKKKLKLFFYEHFDQLLYKEYFIIVWLNSSVYKNTIIINLSPLKPGTKSIWLSSELKVIFIFNYLSYFINSAVNILINFFKYFIKNIYVKLKIIKANTKLNNKLSENKNYYKNNVLFFPHCGVVTFGNPCKDYFYSNQMDSPFHPSKIIHLEHDPRVNTEFEKNKMKKYFKTNFIYYERFRNTHIPWLAILHFIIKIFTSIKLFKYKNLGSNLLYLYIVFFAFVIFKRCLRTLEPYKSAKIALVGYQWLFPKALALSLESLNIRTIAIEDRFLNGYFNNQTFILDTQLSISHPATKKKTISERFLANNIIPVGQPNTDHFFDKNIIKSKYKKKVVILDYHIETDFESEKFQPILNWKNDINFRNEILSLAESNLKIEFIFRGKNCDWYKSMIHKNIILKTNKLTNVYVDTDYSLSHWKSYHLCASADLIIARPSSLAEECISRGLDVIVMDYGINYKTHVSRFLPKLLREYYCYSFDQLNNKFSFWKKNQYVVKKKLKIKIKKQIFSNLADGKVKLRIENYLKKII
jgi:hypothetical protein